MENVDDFVGRQQLGGQLLNANSMLGMANQEMRDAGDADQLLKQLHREEYETWQLVNELIFGENLFFETCQPVARLKSFCPKTLEIERLKTNHNALTIHAVAHWLEKTYKVDGEATIAQINPNLVSR